MYKFNGEQSVIEECERSLKRLQTDYIDLYQMHRPGSTTPIEETMEALQLLKQQGKIRAASICNCTGDLLQRANAVMPVSTNQLAYSMFTVALKRRCSLFACRMGLVFCHIPLHQMRMTAKKIIFQRLQFIGIGVRGMGIDASSQVSQKV